MTQESDINALADKARRDLRCACQHVPNAVSYCDAAINALRDAALAAASTDQQWRDIVNAAWMELPLAIREQHAGTEELTGPLPAAVRALMDNAHAAGAATVIQAVTDPENQPSQFGTTLAAPAVQQPHGDLAVPPVEATEPVEPQQPVQGDREQPAMTDDQERNAFYAVFEEATKKTGHKPAMFDVWLMARGLMGTDGRRVQPTTDNNQSQGEPVESAQVAPAALRDERARFEAWCDDVGADRTYWLDAPEHGYLNGRTCDYRTGWLAALAAEPVKPQEPALPPLLALTCPGLSYSPRAATQAEPQEGMALVPLRPNRDMERVMQEEDWQWSDLLAAAGTVSEEECEAAAQAEPQEKQGEPSKVQIRYELGGRFWHDNCAAASGPGRSMMKPERHTETHSLIRCLRCGVAGWYPVGRVGDVACDQEAVKPSPAQGEPHG